MNFNLGTKTREEIQHVSNWIQPKVGFNTSSVMLGQRIVSWFLCALPLVLVSDISSESTHLFYFAQGIIALLLVATLVLPLREALLFLLMLTLVGNDVGTAFVDMYGKISTTASIWLLYIGPLRPSWIIFTCVLFQFTKLKERAVPKVVKYAVIWFATIPFLASFLYGGIFGSHSDIEVVVDLKFAVMLVASLVLYLSAFRKYPDLLPSILAVLVAGLLARHLVDLAYVFLNFGPEISEGITQGSLDSAKGGVIFLAYFGITLFFVYRQWIVGSLIASSSVFLLAAYGTRMLWITFIIGAIVLFNLFTLRRRLFLACIASALFIIGGWILTIVNPQSAEMAYLRYLTITEGREVSKFSVNVEGNIISRIDPVRYGEFLNILQTTGERFSYLWGSGYGGYYEDKAIHFPDNLGTSFEDYCFATGQFYRAHDYILHVFFKHGLIGLVLISALWFIPGFSAFKFLRNRGTISEENRSMLFSVMRCVVAFMTTSMLQLYWSGKGLFISGMLIAVCIEFLLRNQVIEQMDESLRL